MTPDYPEDPRKEAILRPNLIPDGDIIEEDDDEDFCLFEIYQFSDPERTEALLTEDPILQAVLLESRPTTSRP